MKLNIESMRPLVGRVAVVSAMGTLSIPGAALAAESASASTLNQTPTRSYTGWSLNFTPAVIGPKGGHGWGGGLDPEVKYTVDSGAARISAGLRVGGYYANDLWGLMAMPTLRVTAPIGPVEPYAAFGLGYGWLLERSDEGIASMSRLGVVFRLSERFTLGLEGTLQQIARTDFEFASLGSMVAFEF